MTDLSSQSSLETENGVNLDKETLMVKKKNEDDQELY